jgi:isochorismate synthase
MHYPTSKTPLQIFDDLNTAYTSTFNFIFSSAQTGTWVAASPELLLACSGTNLSTVSLAGTKPADGKSVWTAKEKKEQQYVTDFILQTLQNNNCVNISTDGSNTITAGPVDHLKTTISATASGATNLSQVLADLHPTPATCGIPKDLALQNIIEIEEHDRKFYTGYVGLLNNDRQTFFVNLRCMELGQKSALLYIGGGITADSIAGNEWEETERKAVTLTNVLHS